MKTKVEIGTQVTGKNGKGTITAIITKSTGYVQVTWESGKVTKEMAFNLQSIEGDALKSKPVQSVSKEVNPVTRMTEWVLASVNAGSAGSFLSDCKFSAKLAGNEMVQSIVNYANSYMKISEKQAYVLARFANENSININL